MSIILNNGSGVRIRHHSDGRVVILDSRGRSDKDVLRQFGMTDGLPEHMGHPCIRLIKRPQPLEPISQKEEGGALTALMIFSFLALICYVVYLVIERGLFR